MTKNKTNVTAEPGKQEIVITREFDAPRELVFKAVTDPKLIPQWWGPGYLSAKLLITPFASQPKAARKAEAISSRARLPGSSNRSGKS